MKRLKRLMKACPLVVCLLCSWGIAAGATYLPQMSEKINRIHGEKDPSGDWLTDETEELTANDAINGTIGANRAPDMSEQAILEADGHDEPADGLRPSGEEDDRQTEPENDAATASQEEKPKKTKPKYITYEKKQTDSPWYTDPGKIPLTTEYDYQKVKKDYFDDAVFIGDSRIVGMNDYSGLTNATFFAKTGLTIYNLLDEKFVEDPNTGKNVSVSDMLQNYKYGKIYLMVGINELGTGGTERFAQTYKEVLGKMRKWQPDAVIYVQSIMGVSPKKDRTDEVFNNTNIRDKNCAIAKLTDGIHIFYLNIQELYEDENHALKQDLTFDDVHLYAQYYDKWVKYLKNHAVVKGE